MTHPALVQLIEKTTGLALERGGVNNAPDRFVTDRMQTLRLSRIEEYVVLAADPAGGEQRRLIDAITVPHTWFYRDPEQLQTIARLLSTSPPGPLSVWIAGCATGEEAYTLAMIGRSISRELRVFATDVNERALAAARRGVYSPAAVRDVPHLERRFLVRRDNGYEVDSALRSWVTFARHNLVDPPPQGPPGGWDLVVCRNVLIYFSPAAATRLLHRFAHSIREGGALVVGASEVVFEPPPGLELVSAGHRLVLRRRTRGTGIPLGGTGSHGGAGSYGGGGSPGGASSPGGAGGPGPLSGLRGASPPPSTSRPPTAPQPVPPLGGGDDLVLALSRGHTLFERGEIAPAIEIYDELARAHASVAEVWLFLGIARYVHGDVEDAVNALRACLCLDAGLWPAGFYLARAYERMGRYSEALQQYDLIAVDDGQPLALRSSSAVINELRAFRHDFRNAARRLTIDRNASQRR